ncbi:putative mitochondrial protein [Cucumis melo var. makuwa]|uniref:Mitochondrial protein n=1 Tax=Cucumis melo var. makuwa TaxID=1194695 RepID=A0A5A7VGW3_CUCMM|nr:putative mitochondrial protein [Cucumis melo var. makuwa]
MDVRFGRKLGIQGPTIVTWECLKSSDWRTLYMNIFESENVSKDDDSKKVDESLYPSIIGCLLYLTASRLDIAYVVRVCAHYQADPRESHLRWAKLGLKYVLGRVDFCTWYSFDTTTILVGYYDVDWAGCTNDRKSTSGQNASSVLSQSIPRSFGDLGRMQHLKLVWTNQPRKLKQPATTLVNADQVRRQQHVDAVINDLFREFGTRDVEEESPSRRHSGSSLVVQNVDDGDVPPLEPVHHGFCPPSHGAGDYHQGVLFKWKYVIRRRITDESVVSDQHRSYTTMIDLIDKAGMMCTMTNFGIFYPKLVQEFIVNLPTDFNKPDTLDFWKVYVRGKCVLLSSALLNIYLNTLVPAGHVVILPTLEQLALELSEGLIGTYGINIPICFPRLITSFLLSQDLGMLADDDVVASSSGFWVLRVELRIPTAGLHLPWELVVRVVELLFNKSKKLNASNEEIEGVITMLTG